MLGHLKTPQPAPQPGHKHHLSRHGLSELRYQEHNDSGIKVFIKCSALTRAVLAQVKSEILDSRKTIVVAVKVHDAVRAT